MIHAAVRAAFGVVAHRAGIEHDDVGLFGRGRNAVAGGDRRARRYAASRPHSSDSRTSRCRCWARGSRSLSVRKELPCLPATVAIVGRPNVGKSALFNRLDRPPLGHRRGHARRHPRPALRALRLAWRVPSAWSTPPESIRAPTSRTAPSSPTRRAAKPKPAAEEADVVAVGRRRADRASSARRRRRRDPAPQAPPARARRQQGRVADSARLVHAEFARLGFGEPVAVSAIHGEGTGDLLDAIVELLTRPKPPSPSTDGELALAVIGRPNVGKSSLVNALLGEERTLVSRLPARRATRSTRSSSWHDRHVPARRYRGRAPQAEGARRDRILRGAAFAQRDRALRHRAARLRRDGRHPSAGSALGRHRHRGAQRPHHRRQQVGSRARAERRLQPQRSHRRRARGSFRSQPSRRSRFSRRRPTGAWAA